MAGNKLVFKWAGINSQGKRTDGVIQAADIKEAQLELKKMNVEVITLTQKHAFSIMPARQKKITVKDVQLFTRYLSTMLSAGLPIVTALDLIGHDQENPTMGQLIASLRSDISGGKTLAESFGQHPKYFNELYCNLIKAGEKSGTLEKILARLAAYMERTEALKRKIKKALTYPIAILSIALFVSGILLIFVVPQFDKMFASFGAKLPFFTRMIVNLSDFLRGYWYILLAGIIATVFALRYYIRTSKTFKQRLDRLTLKLYIIGPVLQKGTIARFTRTLSTTLEAGMPIVESMRGMAPVMGNSLYVKAVLKMCEDLNSGHALSASMTTTKMFPNMVIQMVSVGEASGRLSDMLNKIADYYEDEVNAIVDNLSTLIEPLMMLVLGGIVGTFVVAMYLPIFKMGSLM